MMRLLAVVAGLAALGAASSHVPAQDAPERRAGPVGTRPAQVVGITIPRRVATMGAVQPGRIESVAVSEGQPVPAGDVLFVLDDAVQRVRTHSAEADAQSLLDIELAQARYELAQREYERLTGLETQDYSSPKEVADARTSAEAARLSFEIARFEHEQAVRDYERERLALDRMSVRAPFAGYVSEVLKELGETVDEQEGVLTLVQLDPLIVAVDCPLELAPLVKAGDRVPIRPMDERWPTRTGEVTLANRVADAASQTFKVKLTVDNADGAWMSGLKVVVDFSATHADGSGPGRNADAPGI